MRNIMLLIVAFVTVSISAKTQASKKIENDTASYQWPFYGHDAGGCRYSKLNQVNNQNVKQLKLAWTFQTGELKTYMGTKASEKAAFEATPLMIGHTLYFSTPSCRVFAIDAATGEQQWLFDPKVNLHDDFSEITSRGVTSWPADATANTKEQRRIFIGTIDGRLIALNAETGKTISSFGNAGTIDLHQGLGNVCLTSPPAVIGNILVVGSSMGDNYRFDYPPGVVRAYDAISGKLLWSWDPIPQNPNDKAWKTWNEPIAHRTGGANAWSMISVDVQRGLVFIPTSCPSPDYFGGERLGQNLYGNSIVALRASTGKMVWYFQVVHHDLWDYDIAAQPVLLDIIKNGKKRAAVAVGTKMGHVFILDRVTGKPLFPIEERAVPPSQIPGEVASATQPFPILPAPLGLQKLSTKDAWGLTPNDKEEAEKRISKYINKGIFTPSSFQGTIVTPGNAGGIHWGGMCFDPKQNLLITNINWLPAIITILPREKLAQFERDNKDLFRAETGMMEGTPYVMKRDYLMKIDLSNGGLVLQTAPPWGTLVAIDLSTGLKKWESPLGYMLDPNKFPDAKKWGSLNLGGAIVTAGNLTFVAATMDNNLRAFNSRTGELLWEYMLPASAQATPMTYQVNGKQYVVIAAGGHGKLSTKEGDYVVAFAIE